MTRAFIHLTPPPKPAEVVTLRTMKMLQPALVRSNRTGGESVMIAVYVSGSDESTYLRIVDNERLQWSFDPEGHTFIRYLTKDESVTITGGGV